MLIKFPKISIITATLNSEKYLEDTIESVYSQTYQNIEHIIVDGKSEDRTIGIINKNLKKISKFTTERDKGIYDAFNKGVKSSSGNIIYFLNSDDALFDNNIISDVANMFKESDISYLYGNVLVSDVKKKYKYVRGREFMLEDFKSGDMPPHQGFFARRELFEKYDYFDLNYMLAADFDFEIKCFMDDTNSGIYYNRIIAEFKCGGASNNHKTTHSIKAESRSIIKKYFTCSTTHNDFDSNPLFRVWVEKLLLEKINITSSLRRIGVERIVIFGTMKTALCLQEDLKNEGIALICFLDNNQNMQGVEIDGIEVHSPNWLVNNSNNIDAVLISIDGARDIEAREQISTILGERGIVNVYSWKDLLDID